MLLFFIDNEISFSQIGILYAIREISTNVFEIPSGVVADVYGRKNALLGAFLLYIVAFIVFYFSRNFNFLLAAMALIGVSDAFRSGTHKGMIMDYLKINNWGAYKVDYYGHTRSWSQKGSAISALLAGVMVFYSGDYKIIYLLSIIPYLLNLINVYTYPSELNHSGNKKAKKQASIKALLLNLWASFKEKQVLKLVNSSALHSAYLKSIKDYIQALMLNIALLIPIALSTDVKSRSGLVIGGLYFLIFLMTSYASKSSGKVLHFNIRNIELKTLFAGLLAGLFCGVLYYYQLWLLAFVFFVLVYLVENLRKPILTGHLADKVSNQIFTSVMSVQSFYNTVMTAGISILIGVLADYLGIGIALVLSSLLLLAFTGLVEISGAKKGEGQLGA